MRLAQLPRTAVASWRRRRYLASRTPPRLAMGSHDGPPIVYYLAPDDDRPNGGVKVLYKHVDLLNALGYPARILHHRAGFRCRWFENSTPVTSADRVRLDARDVLVIPEMYGSGYGGLPTPVRKLVFNQGPYYTFADLGDDAPPGAPYAGVANLCAVMTVSEDGRRLLKAAFPELDVVICRPVVDEAVFHPGAPPQGMRIGYAPSRRPVERGFVLHALRARGLPAPLVPLHGLSEAQVAEALRECTVFLSFSDNDGFGLPPAEAMACGCYVIGYTGGGGAEFFDPGCSREVVSTLDFVEAVLEQVARPLDELRSLGLQASRRIHGRYDEAGLTADLSAVFGPLLGASNQDQPGVTR